MAAPTPVRPPWPPHSPRRPATSNDSAGPAGTSTTTATTDVPGPANATAPGYYPSSILAAVRAAIIGQPKWFLNTTPPGSEAYAACLDHLNRHLVTVGVAGLRAPALMWQNEPGRAAPEVAAALRAAANTAPPIRLNRTPTSATMTPLATPCSAVDRTTHSLSTHDCPLWPHDIRPVWLLFIRTHVRQDLPDSGKEYRHGR